MTQQPDIVRVKSLDELVEAVPYLLGFTPERSVVLLGMRGTPGRVALTARIDLPPADFEELAIDRVMAAMRTAKARRVLTIIYRDGPQRVTDDDHRLWRVIDDRLVDARMEAADCVLVVGDRSWSLLCADPTCCPPEGRVLPVDNPGRVAAELVFRGEVRRNGRDDIVKEIAYADTLRSRAVVAALDRLRDDYDTYWWESCEEVRELVAMRAADTNAPLPVEQAARVLMAMHRFVRVRDALLQAAGRRPHTVVRSVATDLLRIAPPPYDAAPAAVLAWLAYEDGEGALANIAVDRALAADPSYSLALLVLHAIDNGGHPKILRKARQQATDECRRQERELARKYRELDDSG
jgi:hypothetical protein